MGKITNLGPNHDWTKGHLPKAFGFSQHDRGSKTPAMPGPRRAGPATPMSGDGKHGGGFPMSGDGQRAMPAVQHFAKGGHVKPKFGGGTAKEGAVQEAAEERADAKEDKALVKKGVGQHEDQLHGGKKSTLKLAKGGHVKGLKSLRGARGAKKRTAARGAGPVNRPPANPINDATPAEPMAGGVMPYGTEPGTEADPAGSTQGIPQLKGGGKVKGKR